LSILEVRHLDKVFCEDHNLVQALKDVNLSISRDEFVCLVGPSGCGKSTLLRIVSGLDQASKGDVLFEGTPVTEPTPKISMIFQLFGLLPWKTAQENVEVPLEVIGMDKVERDRVAKDYLRMVQLEGFESTYPHDLSGGMKQRVGIARALALKPELLLMDEPFSSLDELTAKTLRDLVLGIWRRREEPPDCILMVSHNVEEAVYLSDRVVVMSGRPGTVIGDVQVDIPRPRQEHVRDPAYFRLVDQVIAMLKI
jgi:NitT/TauT family transport system ATP-binding protein